jgi:hypothetical protein
MLSIAAFTSAIIRAVEFTRGFRESEGFAENNPYLSMVPFRPHLNSAGLLHNFFPHHASPLRATRGAAKHSP